MSIYSNIILDLMKENKDWKQEVCILVAGMIENVECSSVEENTKKANYLLQSIMEAAGFHKIRADDRSFLLVLAARLSEYIKPAVNTASN